MTCGKVVQRKNIGAQGCSSGYRFLNCDADTGVDACVAAGDVIAVIREA